MTDENLPVNGSTPPRPPTVWTPENTAALITAAIREAQAPLLESVRRKGVPAWLVAALALGACVVLFAVAWAFAATMDYAGTMQRYEMGHLRTATEELRAEAKDANDKRASAEIRAARHEARVSVADAERERLVGELERLRREREQAVASAEAGERLRRENALLRERVAGLEQENAALARQLAALKGLKELNESGSAPSAEKEISAIQSLTHPAPRPLSELQRLWEAEGMMMLSPEEHELWSGKVRAGDSVGPRLSGVTWPRYLSGRASESASSTPPVAYIKAEGRYVQVTEDTLGKWSCFFRLDDGEGNFVYTPYSGFQVDDKGRFVTEDGYFVSSPTGIKVSGYTRPYYISPEGYVFGLSPNRTRSDEWGPLFLFSFENPDKLEAVGDDRWRATDESGEMRAIPTESSHIARNGGGRGIGRWCMTDIPPNGTRAVPFSSLGRSRPNGWQD